MALLYSKTIPFGSPAPDFLLKGIDGKTYSLKDFERAKTLVIVFMCNHCPYVQATWPRLIALQKEFGAKGVQFIGINSNDSTGYPEDNFENMKKYSAERGSNFPYLHDETQEVARAYGAVCTPDIFVYGRAHILKYHGRMDDNWREPEKAAAHELSDAIKAILRGEDPDRNQNPSMGCSIKWK